MTISGKVTYFKMYFVLDQGDDFGSRTCAKSRDLAISGPRSSNNKNISTVREMKCLKQ